MKAYVNKEEIELILTNRVKKFNSKVTQLYLSEESIKHLDSSISSSDKIMKELIDELDELDGLFKVQWSNWHFEVGKQT